MRMPSRWFRVLFCLVMAACASFFQSEACASELDIPPEAQQAINLMYSGKSEEAVALAHKLEAARPDHPLGYLIEADILSLDFDTLVQGSLTGLSGTQSGGPGKIARVVGNLPYHITSDIFLKLFDFHRNFDIMVLMVQREVADRLSAKPGSRDYGLVTATANLFADVENLFTLPPSAFSPPPKVHSSVLRLRIAPKSKTLGIDADAFIDFLKICFAQKRKTLVNNLKAAYDADKLRAALTKARIRPDARAEAISLEKMAEVFKQLRSIED